MKSFRPRRAVVNDVSSPFPLLPRLATVALLSLGFVAFAGVSVAQADPVSTVDGTGSNVTFEAGAGIANQVTISLSGSDLIVADTGGALAATGSCFLLDGNTASCPAAGVTAITVNAGDLDDGVTSNVATNTTLNGQEGNDTLKSGGGADTLVGGDGDDTIEGSAGDDTLQGGVGVDTVSYASATSNIRVYLSTTTPQSTLSAGTDTISGFENVTGGSGTDSLYGSSGDNVVDGGTNNDNLYGGYGNDTLLGGDGNDNLYGENGDDLLEGGIGGDVFIGAAGTDTVTYEPRVNPVTVTVGLLKNDGDASDGPSSSRDDVRSDIEIVIGGSAGDSLTGSAGVNTLRGGPGGDTISGGGGQDSLYGDSGSDTISAADGFVDTARCGDDDDTLTADTTDNVPDGDCETTQLAPNTWFTGSPAALTADATPVYEFASDLAGSSFECRIDAGTYYVCESPHEVAALPDGLHNIQVRAIGPGGPDPWPAFHEFTVDTTAPTVTVNTGGLVAGPDVVFDFQVSDANALPASTCVLDGGQPSEQILQPCYPNSTIATLDDGEHTLQVTALDAVGNAGASGVGTFTVDGTPPVVTVSAPADQGVITTDTPTVVFGLDELNPSSDSICVIDAGNATEFEFPCVSGDPLPQPLDPGEHTLVINHTDLAGNVGSSDYVTFTYEPVASIVNRVTPGIGPSYYQFNAATGAINDLVVAADSTNVVFSDATTAIAAGDDCDQQDAYTVSCAAGLPFVVADLGDLDDTFTANEPATLASSVAGGPGNDVLQGGDGNDNFRGGPGDDVMTGGAGTDMVNYYDSTLPVTVTLDGEPNDGDENEDDLVGASIENLMGGAAAGDTLTGDGANNRIDGLGGNDEIDGGAGNDELYGGDGDDIVDGGADADKFFGGDGFDTIDYSSRTEAVTVWNGSSVGASGESGEGDEIWQEFDRVLTGSGNDTIHGTGVDETIDPGTGEDTIEASTGADTMLVRDGGLDHVQCGVDTAADTVTADVADDVGGECDANDTVDRGIVPPVVTITGAIDEGARTNDPTPTFYFEADVPATFECRADEGEWVACETGFTFEPIAVEGAHAFSVRATDPSTNAQSVVVTRAFVYDVTPPDTVITDPSSTGDPLVFSQDGTLVMSFDSPDTDAESFECSLDFSAFSACNSPYAIAAPAQCLHYVTVRAIDAAGNVDDSPAPLGLITNATTSDIETVLQCPGTAGGTPPLSLLLIALANGEFAPEASFECKMNQRPWQPCSPPFMAHVYSTATQTISARATVDGQTDPDPPVVQFAITGDPEPVDTVIDDRPPSATTESINTVTFHSTAPDAVSECRVDGGQWQPCTSPYTVNLRDYYPTGSLDGPHSIDVRSLVPDEATGSTQAVEFDFYTPRSENPVFERWPAGQTDSPVHEFEFDSITANTTFECSVDGAEWTQCASPYVVDLQSMYPGVSVDGSHTLSVRAKTGEYLASYPETVGFVVALRGPRTTIHGPASGDRLEGLDAIYSFTSPEGAVAFECSVDGGAFGACSSPYVLAENGGKARTFAVRALDVFGRVGRAVYRKVYFDAQPDVADIAAPETTIDDGPIEGLTVHGGDVRFAFSANEDATFTCVVDNGAPSPCDSPLELTGLVDGAHSLAVVATDTAGNADATPAVRNFSVALDESKRPWVVFDSTPSPVVIEPNVEVTFHSNVNEAMYECALDSGDWEPCDSPYNVDAAGLDVGQHQIRVRALANGMTSEPRITWIEYVPQTASIQWTAGPADGERVLSSTVLWQFGSLEPVDHFECSLDDGPSMTCAGEYQATDLGDGTHTLIVRAVTGDGRVLEADSRRVVVDTSASVEGQPGDTQVTFGPNGETITTAEATFGFTGLSDDRFLCSIDDDPFSPCVSPFSTPALSNGQHKFRVRTRRADDSLGVPTIRIFVVDAPITHTSYERLVEPGPDGDRFTERSVDALFAALAQVQAGNGSGGTGGTQGVTNTTPLPTNQELVDFMSTAGVLPSHDQIVKDMGSILVNSQTQYRYDVYNDGILRANFVVTLHGGNFQTWYIDSGALIPYLRQATWWSYNQSRNRLDLWGDDLRPGCINGCSTGPTRWVLQQNGEPSSVCGDEVSPIQLAFSEGATVSANIDVIHVSHICDNGVPVEYDYVEEWRPIEGSFAAFNGSIQANVFCTTPCGVTPIDLEAQDRKRMADNCRLPQFQNVCAYLGGQGGSDPFGYGKYGGSPQAGDPVNTANGNLVIDETDLVSPSAGADFPLQRTYNSLKSASSELGRGWTWSGSERVFANALGELRVVRSDGRIETHKPNGDGSFAAPPGVKESITVFDSGVDRYELRSLDGSWTKRYGLDGRLRTLFDSSGNATSYVYDENGHLSSVTNASANSITFGYSPDGLLTTAADSLGHVIDYEYSQGRLTGVEFDDGSRYEYTYDESDRLVTVTDPNDRVTMSNTYDELGRVVGQLDANSRSMEFDYSDGRTAITDDNGRRYWQRYDENYKLVESVEPGQRRATAHYDVAGNLVRVDKPDGRSERWTYDANGNMVQHIDAAGNTTSHTYDADGRETSITDPRGNTTEFEYNANGDLTVQRDPLGNEVQMGYVKPGLTSSVRDANGNITTYQYDAADRLVAVGDAEGGQEQYTYYPNGSLHTITDGRGKTTTLERDVRDRLTRVTDPMNGLEQLEYDPAGDLTRTIDSLGRVRDFTRDPSGRATAVTDSFGTVTNEFGQFGELERVTMPGGLTDRIVRDALGQPIRQVDAGGSTRSKAYDDSGRLIAVTDARGNRTRYEYDAADNVTAVTDAAGSRTSYTYDAGRNLTSRTDAKGAITTFEYDALSRLIRKYEPLGRTTEYAYDAVGNLVSVTVGGEVTSYAYDAKNRLVSILLEDDRSQSIAYDASDNVVSVWDFDGNHSTRQYNDNGQVTRFDKGDGTVVQLSYDAAGRPISYEDARGTTSLEYGANGLARTVIEPSGLSHRNRYNAVGSLVGTRTYREVNGADKLAMARTYVRDRNQRVIAIIMRDSDGVTTRRIKYEYDSEGNQTARMDGGERSEYVYDELNRLVEVHEPDGETKSYSYDVNGNRISDDGVTYQFDALNRVTGASDGKTYAYDSVGRIATMVDGGVSRAFTYDSMNRVRTMVRGNVTTELSYDEESRLSKIVAPDFERRYYYGFDDRPIREASVAGQPGSTATRNRDYFYNSAGLVSIRENDVTSLIPSVDERGSVLDELDLESSSLHPETYDAFGAPASTTADPVDPFEKLDVRSLGYLGAQGKATIYGTGLVQMGERVFDPALGAFTSRDPEDGLGMAPSTQNPYAYALDNPLRYFDLDGRSPRDGGKPVSPDNGPLDDVIDFFVGSPIDVLSSVFKQSRGTCTGFELGPGRVMAYNWCRIHTPNGSGTTQSRTLGTGLSASAGVQKIYGNGKCMRDVIGESTTFSVSIGRYGFAFSRSRNPWGHEIRFYSLGLGIGPFGVVDSKGWTELLSGNGSLDACPYNDGDIPLPW